jgi:hypothetical protein
MFMRGAKPESEYARRGPGGRYQTSEFYPLLKLAGNLTTFETRHTIE